MKIQLQNKHTSISLLLCIDSLIDFYKIRISCMSASNIHQLHMILARSNKLNLLWPEVNFIHFIYKIGDGVISFSPIFKNILIEMVRSVCAVCVIESLM